MGFDRLRNLMAGVLVALYVLGGRARGRQGLQ